MLHAVLRCLLSLQQPITILLCSSPFTRPHSVSPNHLFLWQHKLTIGEISFKLNRLTFQKTCNKFKRGEGNLSLSSSTTLQDRFFQACIYLLSVHQFSTISCATRDSTQWLQVLWGNFFLLMEQLMLVETVLVHYNAIHLLQASRLWGAVRHLPYVLQPQSRTVGSCLAGASRAVQEMDVHKFLCNL